MELPDNWLLFKNKVKENIRLYCNSGIWPFKYQQFTAWLNNFDDPLEEYVALQLIDSLIVKSNIMVKVGYARLLHGQIRQLLIDQEVINKKTNIEKWKFQLRNGGLQETIRFSPVHKKNDFGDSGSSIYRMLSSEINTNYYALSDSCKNTKVIILIDDLVGSGKQFIDSFSQEFGLDKKLENKIIIYCPIIGFETGLEKIKQQFPKLILLPVETITKEASFFSENKLDFFKNDQINTVQDVENYFAQMHEKYAPKMSNWFGFESAALPLAFEWGCPNQSPSILWMDRSSYKDDWHSLFDRRS